MSPKLIGIHHVTAVTANARLNHQFYTRVLGMRLVKKTVNQDDLSAYHLFYADAQGSPGSDLTFFDWAHSPRQRHGNNSISSTGLRVGGADSLAWWIERFDQFRVPHSPIVERGGRAVVDFQDGEGQRLTLLEDGNTGKSFPWSGSPVPLPHQIRGLGPVTITVPEIQSTGDLLTQVLGLRPKGKYADPEGQEFSVQIYEMGDGGASAELHVRIRPDLTLFRPGSGGVHHVAFRVPDEETYHSWTARLRSLGIPNSGEIDRYYFKSLYFREPNQILFELATDGPGFAVDESISDLGNKLALPPFLEKRRAAIEANLQPL
ncbi:MAG: ring-cleaving dioxygenase [Verrucomicrobia bacterium]|nr:ring-cleaving dioxygenase [Verrucomicrobiota bacterium]